MRKDIENMHVILLAIERLEKQCKAGDINGAIQLDSLYTAFKSQAKTVIENEQLNNTKGDIC